MKKRQLNRYEWIWLVIVALAIFYFTYSYLIVDINIEPMKGSLSENNLYFEVYKENISFGEVPINYQMKRMTRVINEFDFPVKVYFFPRGEMSKFVEIQPNQLYLEKNETKEINIYFRHNTLEAELREYQGSLIILTRRAIFGV